MAVLFLLLALLLAVVVAAVGFENTTASSVTLLDRSLGQLTEGQLLVLFAGLGFLIALFLSLAFGASRISALAAQGAEVPAPRRRGSGRRAEAREQPPPPGAGVGPARPSRRRRRTRPRRSRHRPAPLKVTQP